MKETSRKSQVPLRVYLLAALLVLALGAGAAYAQSSSYDLSWWTVDGGGGAVGGGTYVLLGTAGQPDAGPALGDAGGRFTLLGGFWPAAVGEEGNPAVYLPLVVSGY